MGRANHRCSVPAQGGWPGRGRRARVRLCSVRGQEEPCRFHSPEPRPQLSAPLPQAAAIHFVGSACRSAGVGPIPEGGRESVVSYGANTIGSQLP